MIEYRPIDGLENKKQSAFIREDFEKWYFDTAMPELMRRHKDGSGAKESLKEYKDEFVTRNKRTWVNME